MYAIRWTAQFRARLSGSDAGLDGIFDTLEEARATLRDLASYNCVGTLRVRRERAIEDAQLRGRDASSVSHSDYSLVIVRGATARYAVRQLGCSAWEDGIRGLRAARRSLCEARDAGLTRVVVVREDGADCTAECDGAVRA